MLYVFLLSCSSIAPFPSIMPDDFERYLGMVEPSSIETDGVDSTYIFDVEDGPICLRGEPFQSFTRTGTSNSLLIYLQGGGACWSDNCLAFDVTPSGVRQYGVLNSNLEQNPFSDWNVGYVPYCDGSVFGGDREIDDDGDGSIDRYHRGFLNLSVAMDAIHREYPDPDRIALVGISGGAYGAIIGGVLARLLWPNHPVDVIADGGLGLGKEGDVEFLTGVLNEWNALPLFPPDCSNCFEDGHATGVASWILSHDPHLRYFNISSEKDYVIGTLFLGGSGDSYQQSVQKETQKLAENHPNQYRRFIYSGMQHTSLVLDSTTDLSDGIMGLDEDVLENLLGRFDVVDINGITVSEWLTHVIDEPELPTSLNETP